MLGKVSGVLAFLPSVYQACMFAFKGDPVSLPPMILWDDPRHEKVSHRPINSANAGKPSRHLVPGDLARINQILRCLSLCKSEVPEVMKYQ